MTTAAKRTERYHGLHVAPTFEQAISQKLNRIKLPALKNTDFYNSPAYQGLLNMQQAVETEAELDARRAQLKVLMTRVAHEHNVSVTHVHQMVNAAARAGAKAARSTRATALAAWSLHKTPRLFWASGAAAAA